MPNTLKHILVIRLSAMGDVAMVVPVLRALSTQHPGLKVTVLTRPKFTPLFRDLKNVKIVSGELKGRHKGIQGLYKLSQSLKSLDIDAVADLHNVLRTNILRLFFLGTTFIQIDKGRSEKKDLVSGKKVIQLKTTHQRYADVFDKLGLKLNLNNPSFPERAKLNVRAIKLISQDSKKWVGIAPFAQYESKMYPLDLMEKVIEELSKKYKVILFGGGHNEIEQLDTFENRHTSVVNVSGKLSLDEELDVISNLDAMLSMDSANGHLAAMLGVKVVTIWGVTHPYAGFMPFNQPIDYAILADSEKFPLIPTSIYGNKYPEHYKKASGTIGPEAIINKVESIF